MKVGGGEKDAFKKKINDNSKWNALLLRVRKALYCKASFDWKCIYMDYHYIPGLYCTFQLHWLSFLSESLVCLKYFSRTGERICMFTPEVLMGVSCQKAIVRTEDSYAVKPIDQILFLVIVLWEFFILGSS